MSTENSRPANDQNISKFKVVLDNGLKNVTSLWAHLIIEELVRNGIDYFCISPGSRSTPLTAAVAQSNRARSVICYDERGAGFHALGYAKSTKKPAVLICTSGTAAANYYPAIIEAHQSSTPMLVLTADRPPELRQTGANQTIDQVKMYGSYVNWFFDLPVPDTKINPSNVLAIIDQAVFQSVANRPGPVHLNCMFREPLEPGDITEYGKQLAFWWHSTDPLTKIRYPSVSYHKNELSDLAKRLVSGKKGLLVVGRLDSSEEMHAVTSLACKLAWPVFADISSGIRNSSQIKNLIIHFDQILANEKLKDLIKPDIILHIGPVLTSKRYLLFSEAKSSARYIQICSDSGRYDPAYVVNDKYPGDITSICNGIAANIAIVLETAPAELRNIDEKISNGINAVCRPDERISEISLARLIAENLPAAHALFIGNSMPIRDFDTFADFYHFPVKVGCNRGASGIDGNLASALGYASGLKQPLTLVVGDLTLIHDLNSLTMLASCPYPIVIIVINNHGGGIFSFLPIAKYSDIFEKYFATPHELAFSHIAQMFNIEYYQPETNYELVEQYKSSAQSGKNVLIEISTNRETNRALHQKIQQDIISEI